MGKKVLVITASPRKDSGTKKLADAFVKGAEKSGNEVFLFDAGHKKMAGCLACNRCWSRGYACVQEDDFLELSLLLEKCDVLLISTPLYWLSFPAQVKGAIDRLYAYGGSGGPRPLAVKESLLFVSGELPGADKEYDPIVQIYQTSAEFLGWKDCGVIRCGASEIPDYMEKAAAFGRNIG